MQPYFNPWAAIFDQLWVCQRVGETMLKCVEIELFSSPVALAKYSLEPSEARLNPLEFHGARRDAPPPVQPKQQAPSHRMKSVTLTRRNSQLPAAKIAAGLAPADQRTLLLNNPFPRLTRSS